MPRLFIDVDDTLVIYPDHLPGPNPAGLRTGLSHRANAALVNAIHVWQATNVTGQVVVWSGGGEEYARDAANMFIPDVQAWHFTKAGQNLMLPAAGDTVVDDEPESLGIDGVAGDVQLPDQFIQMMNT
jgi:hypothetical protein